MPKDVQQICRALLTLVLLLVSINAYCSDCIEKDRSNCPVRLYTPDSFRFENDMFSTPTNDDQNYTFGLIFDWGSDIASRHALHTEFLQKSILKKIPHYNTLPEYFGLQIGLTAFTPDDLPVLAPITTDRPYGSLIYVHSDVYRGDMHSAVGVGTTIGAIGTNAAEVIQSEWHSVLRSLGGSQANPEGWSNQIGEGGEITGMLDINYHRRLHLNPRNIDLIYTADVSVGFYSRVGLGLVARIGGTIDKYKPVHYTGSLATPVGPGTFNTFVAGSPEQFLYMNFKGNYIGYNALLECQGESVFCLDRNEIRNVVWESSIGYSYPRGREKFITRIDGSLHWRSKETKLAEARNHGWGGVTFHFR